MLKGCVILYRACFENGKEFVALRLRRPVTQVDKLTKTPSHVSGDICVQDLGGTTFRKIYTNEIKGAWYARKAAFSYAVEQYSMPFTEYMSPEIKEKFTMCRIGSTASV